MSRDNSRDPTPYAVVCPNKCGDGTGRVFLSVAQYDFQMAHPDSFWKCPSCGDDAEWDDSCQETDPPDPEDT